MATALTERRETSRKMVYKFAGLTPSSGTIELHPVVMGDSSKVVETYGVKLRTVGGRLVDLKMLVPDAPAYTFKPTAKNRSGIYGEESSGDKLTLDEEFATMSELHVRATQRPPTRRHALVAPFPQVRVVDYGGNEREYIQQTIGGEPIDMFFQHVTEAPLSDPEKNLLQLVVLHNAIVAIERIHELAAIHGDLRTPNLVVDLKTLNVIPVDFGNTEFDTADPELPKADGNKFVLSVRDNDHVNRTLWARVATFEQDIEMNLSQALQEQGKGMADLPMVQKALGERYYVSRLDMRIQRGTYGAEHYSHTQLTELSSGLDEVFYRSHQHPESFASERRYIA